MGFLILLIILGIPTYFIWKSVRKKANQMRAEIKAKELDDAELNKLLEEGRKEYEEATGEKYPETDIKSISDDFDIFNDPYIETAAKANRNSPIILTFIYEKHDKDGNVTGTQERAIHPYMKDDEYIEGYCLDREEVRTFRIDRIVRFTGNSEAIFDGLD